MGLTKRTVSKLFHPIKINETEIKNRIAMAMGMDGMVTDDGCFTKRARDYYVEKAMEGTGLIISSVTKVEHKIEVIERGTFPNVSIKPIHFIETASEMTERVHAYDSKIFLKLAVGFGRVASLHILKSKPVAPAAVPNYWDPSVTCRKLTAAEIEKLIQKTIEAAVIANKAGFDGVKIHAVHDAVHEGYLLDQFEKDRFNNRTDNYGGKLKNRLRLSSEIVKGIKNKLGKDFPVQGRKSVNEHLK